MFIAVFIMFCKNRDFVISIVCFYKFAKNRLHKY